MELMIDKQRLWLLVWKYEEKKYYSLERWLFLCLTAWHKLYWKWKVKTRKVKVKSNNQQWMNGEVRKVINNRYKLLLKARETPKNSKEWAEYRKATDRCTNLNWHAEATYWKEKFSSADCAKSFWSLVRKFQKESHQHHVLALRNKTVLP